MTFDPAIVGNAVVAYQGAPAAFSHQALNELFPDATPLACPTFDEALSAIKDGRADYGVIPIENTLAGRVADIHQLLPGAHLYIVGEYFLRIRHQLVAPKGATLEGLKTVHSHQMALAQCRDLLNRHHLTPVVHDDTAGAARDVALWNDPTVGAIASSLAAETYGLDTLAANVEDAAHNTTRFIVLSRSRHDPPQGAASVTTFVFRVRNVPAALYKALGGFATNGINMTKLESYQIEGSFTATQFYADIEGHPNDRSVQLAFEELAFFSTNVTVLGCYPAHPFRTKNY
ncbi:prephenate dehydratase [Zavarzinia compransoris]|uniref:prephenate dehydratase n=1 Tax=Zavarzinia marina TaxID=2911065 RepID=UPI001F46473C|nr:prephenate dehydratase [Zavarzinia marina]MCF4165823.1 prephenate dehydratase [Zavarzinia marina]